MDRFASTNDLWIRLAAVFMELAIGLLALTAMEIVLGIDNIVFITVVSARLPRSQQPLARKLGLLLALATRLLLLFTLFYMVHDDHFKKPIFELTDLGIPQSVIERFSVIEPSIHAGISKDILDELSRDNFNESNGISWKDLILFLGGLFLVGKSVFEIHDEIGHKGDQTTQPTGKQFVSVLIQIALLDVVFSLDSVITAVGMVDNVWVMVASIVMAVLVMLIFAEPVSHFVESHPTLKVLALSFLILIGVMLVAEGVGAHLDKGYIYFAMFFGLIVEVINIAARSRNGDEHPMNA